MPYVQRTNDVVIALYGVMQPGIAEEFLADDHPDVLAITEKQPPTDQERLNAELAAPGSIVRALALVMLDELNAHAATINATLTAIDNGSTLEQIKSNVAAVADYPIRTAPQLITALEAKMPGN